MHLGITGSHRQQLLKIEHSKNHGRLYLPEPLVLSADEYAKQRQEEGIFEAKEAKKWGVSIDEYREQMIEQKQKHQQEYSLTGNQLTLPAVPSDPSHFTVGTMVEVQMQQGPPLNGIIQWIGTLPGFDGSYAGVELVR